MTIPYVIVYSGRYGIVLIDEKDNSINYERCNGRPSNIKSINYKDTYTFRLRQFIRNHNMVTIGPRSIAKSYLEQYMMHFPMCEHINYYEYLYL